MAGNAKTRIFAGAAYTKTRAGIQLRGGLFRRTPGDTAWQALSNGLPENVEARAFAVHPQNPDVITLARRMARIAAWMAATIGRSWVSRIATR